MTVGFAEAGMALALFGLQTTQPVWTWTLYDSGRTVVLANEAPDTPNLKATLECERGAGAIRVSAYGPAAVGEFAVLSAGQASATAQVTPRQDRIQATIPAAHPVFTAFTSSGRLTLTVGEVQRAVTVDQIHLANLRRFAELCAA